MLKLKWGFLLGVLFSSVAFANTVNMLYTVEMPVASQSQADKEQALPEAFQAVLVKVSGNSAAATNKMLQAHLSDAASAVREYTYQGSNLQIHFDPHVINDWLTQADFSVWGKQRPLTLLWLAETLDQNTSLVGHEATGGLPAVIQAQAFRRGMPILLPVMDAQDIAQITPDDVVAVHKDILDKTSQRYHPDGILTGHLSRTGEGWMIHWSYWGNVYTKEWDSAGASPTEVLDRGLEVFADDVGSHFARQTPTFSILNRANQVLVTVSHLDSMEAYAKVLKYFHGLSAVKSVSVVSVGSAQTVFALNLNTDQQTLQKIISLDDVLIPLKDSGNGLYYQWAS